MPEEELAARLGKALVYRMEIRALTFRQHPDD